MKSWFAWLWSVALMPAAWASQAEDARVEAAWLRQAPPGADMSAAFLRLRNAGQAELVLVGAGSPGAGSVALHGHSHEGGVMRMRPVARLAVPAGETVVLEPGGLHLMVFELKVAPQPGEAFVLELRFADGSRRDVAAQVRSALE